MLKKIALITTFTFLCITSLFSQEKFRLSFVASPQLGWIKTSDHSIEDAKARFGFNFGIESDIFLDSDKRYSFLTGVMLSSMGSKVTYNEDKVINDTAIKAGEDVKIGYKFIEIPAAIKLRSNQTHRSVFYAQFGLSNWINIGSSITTEDDALKGDSIKDNLSFFNMGYNVGGGLEYDLGGRNALNIGVLYQNGFTDISTNDSFMKNSSLRNVRLNLAFIF
ncbi:PorT family protein [Halosquirtibacter laminarini]|uniref:PorT family protein n=1 Tax=Halosquirtibacter laminarini TaxID=3374600 RepID=A0AC61NJF6_9BACT|nr:PorT family protein [Prolixibacteraceae bacterium]